MPGGKVVLVMTRWHETDLAGYLLEQQDTAPMADKWEVVRIPALNTTESLDCLLYTSPSPRDRTRSRMPSSA